MEKVEVHSFERQRRKVHGGKDQSLKESYLNEYVCVQCPHPVYEHSICVGTPVGGGGVTPAHV